MIIAVVRCEESGQLHIRGKVNYCELWLTAANKDINPEHNNVKRQ